MSDQIIEVTRATHCGDGAVPELQELLAKLDISVPTEALEQIDIYRQLLWAWNKNINLTRHTTLEKFVNRDILDSFHLAQLLSPGERVLDIGTGGGVPGLLIHFLRPDLKLTLCDSTGKKAAVVDAIVSEMGVPVTVRSCRGEEVLATRRFDTVLARAVAPLSKMLRWFEGSWSDFDRLLLIKGRNWVTERADARRAGLLGSLELRKASFYQAVEGEGESVILSVSPKKQAD